MLNFYEIEKDFKKKILEIHYLNNLNLNNEQYQILKDHSFEILKKVNGIFEVSERISFLKQFQCSLSAFLVWFYKIDYQGGSYWNVLYSQSKAKINKAWLVKELQNVFKYTVKTYNLFDFSSYNTSQKHLNPIKAHAFFSNHNKKEENELIKYLYSVYVENYKDLNAVKNRIRQIIELVRNRNQNQINDDKNKIKSQLDYIQTKIKELNILCLKDGFTELITFNIDSLEQMDSKISTAEGYLKTLKLIAEKEFDEFDKIEDKTIESIEDTSINEINEKLTNINSKIAAIQKALHRKKFEFINNIPELEKEIKRLRTRKKNFLTKFVEFYHCNDENAINVAFKDFDKTKNQLFKIITELADNKLIPAQLFDFQKILTLLLEKEEKLKNEIKNFEQFSETSKSSLIHSIPKSVQSVFALHPSIAENQLLKIFLKYLEEGNITQQGQQDENKLSPKKKIHRYPHNNIRPSIIFSSQENQLLLFFHNFYFSNMNKEDKQLTIKISSDFEQLYKNLHAIQFMNTYYYIQEFTLPLEILPNELYVEIFDENGTFLYKDFYWELKRKRSFIFDPDSGSELESIERPDEINIILEKDAYTNGIIKYQQKITSKEKLEQRVLHITDSNYLEVRKNESIIWQEPFPKTKLWYELDSNGRIFELNCLQSFDENSNIQQIPVYNSIPNIISHIKYEKDLELKCSKYEEDFKYTEHVNIRESWEREEKYSYFHQTQIIGDKEITTPAIYKYQIGESTLKQETFIFYFLYLPGLFCSWSKSIQLGKHSNIFLITNNNFYSLIFLDKKYNEMIISLPLEIEKNENSYLTVSHESIKKAFTLELKQPLLKWELKKNNILNNKTDFWIEDIAVNGNLLLLQKLFFIYEKTPVDLYINNNYIQELQFKEDSAEINIHELLNNEIELKNNSSLVFFIRYQEEKFKLFTVRTEWHVENVSIFEEQEETLFTIHITWSETVSPKTKIIRVWRLENSEYYTFIDEKKIERQSTEAFIQVDFDKYNIGVYAFEFTYGVKNLWGRKPDKPKGVIYKYQPGKEFFYEKIKNKGIIVTAVKYNKEKYSLTNKLLIKNIVKTSQEKKIFEQDDLLQGDVYYKKGENEQFISESSPVYFYVSHIRNYIAFIVDKDRDGAQYDKNIGEIYWETRPYDNDQSRVLSPLDKFFFKAP